MKDKIIEYLDVLDKAKSLEDICNYVKGNEEGVEKELNNLIKSGIVHETKKKKYILMKYCKSLHVGKIDVARNGYAFLVQNDNSEDIFIAKDNLNGAIEGDTALVDLYSNRGKLEGKVLKILDRSVNKLVGEILYVNNVPEND